jgi:hydrogenase nickel incorporation protein HypB
MKAQVITVERDVLTLARASAAEFRQQRTAAGTLVVNLVSSPGAGKTALLEATARYWAGRRRMAVLVGDLATDRDAQRLAPMVEVVQMTTGGACHLELPLVERAFGHLASTNLDFLFVENVGNLVCPASHDLGEHVRVALLSVTEGDDKPGKYPKMFRTSHALVISKTDLLPHVPFSVAAAAADARLIQPHLPVLAICAPRGEGLDAWCRFLDEQRQRLQIDHS